MLPRHDLGWYLAEGIAFTPDEQDIIDGWLRGRGQVAGFMRTNFYKRLSSCGHSFVLSLKRHTARNKVFLYDLNNGLPVPTGSSRSRCVSAGAVRIELCQIWSAASCRFPDLLPCGTSGIRNSIANVGL